MKARKIFIKTDFVVEVNNIFHHFSGQLSDGYWENSGGEWGTYKDEYYPDIWNCFDFTINKDNNFVITLKGKPIYKEATEDCEKMHEWTDTKIAEYLKEALIYSIEEAPCAFSRYSDRELEVIINCINNWTILPPPLPKLSHAELVKIVGYDFEYTK